MSFSDWFCLVISAPGQNNGEKNFEVFSLFLRHTLTSSFQIFSQRTVLLLQELWRIGEIEIMISLTI